MGAMGLGRPETKFQWKFDKDEETRNVLFARLIDGYCRMYVRTHPYIYMNEQFTRTCVCQIFCFNVLSASIMYMFSS